MQTKTSFARLMMVQNSMRMFSTAKLPQLEVTLRTPYRTLFENFSGFEFFYVSTIKGNKAIVNSGVPATYLLPAGQIQFINMTEGQGKKTESTSGLFMHTGGWVHVHE